MKKSRLIIQFRPILGEQAFPEFLKSEINSWDQADMLTKAIEFYNYTTRGVIKQGWGKQLDFNTLDKNIRFLRYGYNKSLQALFHSFYLQPPKVFQSYYRKEEFLYSYGKQKVNPDLFDKAHRARYTIRVFISSMFRTQSFIEGRKEKKKFSGIKLEGFPKLLNDIRSRFHQLLLNEEIFGAPISASADFDFSEPFDFSAFLYRHVAGINVADASYGLPLEMVELKRLIDKIEIKLSAVHRKSSAKAANSFFQRVAKNLDLLEAYFTKRQGPDFDTFGLIWALALIYTLRVYLVQIKLRVLQSSYPVFNFYDTTKLNSHIGICLWEALSGRQVVTPSLPGFLDMDSSTRNYYEAKSKYEEQDKTNGYIIRTSREEGALTGALRDNLVYARHNILGLRSTKVGKGELPVSASLIDIENLISDFLQYPIILRSNHPVSGRNGKKSKKGADRFTFENIGLLEFKDRIENRNPVMLRGSGEEGVHLTELDSNYYRITNIIPNPVSLLNFGNSFSTQLYFFVASKLLKMASDQFGLAEFYLDQWLNADQSKISEYRERLRMFERKYPPGYKAFLNVKLKLQRLVEFNRFVLTAGSYLHGGSFPPHKTHRDGRHFDISMGPNLIPWRTTSLGKTLGEVYKYLKEKKGTGLDLLKDKVPGTIYKVERIPGDVTRERVPVIDHNFMRKRVDEVGSKLTEVDVSNTHNGESIQKDVDGDAMGSHIKKLYGSPHFQSEDDAELGHIGTLAILLSFPTRIVYASPIVIFRGLRSVKKAMQYLEGENLFLEDFDVEKKEQLEERIEELIKCMDVAFLPSDHHHHWHLYYPELNPDVMVFNSKKKKYVESKCKKLQRHEVRLELVAPIWLLLDIDLSEFLEYLRIYEKQHIVDHSMPESKQLAEVILFVEQYEKLRAKRSSNKEAKELSERILFKLFNPHIMNGTLDKDAETGVELAPAVNHRLDRELLKRSNKIKDHIKRVRKELENIEPGDQEEENKLRQWIQNLHEEAEIDDSEEDALEQNDAEQFRKFEIELLENINPV